jgi:GAF domain-containing protein
MANHSTRALILVGRVLSAHFSLPEFLEAILDVSVEAFTATRGILMTVEGEALQVRAVRGDHFPISPTVRDRVLQSKESLLVRDAQLDPALCEDESIVAQQVKSLIAVPLQANDRVIGLIYVDTPHLLREFSRDDLNLLTVMASVAAIRIERSRQSGIEAL